MGERLLVDCQLLDVEGDDLRPSSELVDLLAAGESQAVAVILELAVGFLAERQLSTLMKRQDAIEELTRAVEPDPDRREELLLRLARRFDTTARRLLGERGEEHVVSQAVSELKAIGRLDLASRVRRVSGASDQLGYDVIAPRLGGMRRLEVKTAVARHDGLFHFFLSRGEYETGRRDLDWAIVACELLEERIVVIGWSRAVTVEPYLPVDTDASRWASADVLVPAAILHRGLPPAI